MAHNVSNEYKQVIYSQQAKNKLKLLFNNVELQDADRYCEKLTVKSRIIPNGAKIFNLNNFISKEADLILHDIDTSIIQNQVSISIGTLVGNSYEYVPIGIFNIENQPTNDKDKTTIKLRDNSVKFDFNYNAQPLIEENGGSATKLQILQDICTQAGVTCNITSFIGYVDDIGVYDNTITAREYISRIAEQAGRIATINRNGELIFVDLNNLTTWEIPIEIVEKYENGTKYKIGRVVYEDGIVRYETPTSNDDTLFLDGSNNYINGELVKEQASSNDNTYYLQDSGDSELAYLELEGKTTQETRSGKNLLDLSQFTTQTISGVTFTKNNNGSITLNGTASSAITLDTPIKVIVLQSGTSYTLSKSTTYAGANYAISLRQQNSSVVGTTGLDSGSNSLTYNLATTTSAYYFRIYVVSGKTFNNHTIYPMLEEGSTATEYEKYGLMPSPDYPSELVSVGYENLFDISAWVGANVLINNGVLNNVDANGITITSTANDCYTRYGNIPTIGVEPNTTYTLSFNKLNNTVGSQYVIFFNENDTQLGMVNTSTLTRTFTTPSNCKYIRVRFGIQNAGLTETFYDIQITKGTQAHSYIPYGKYGIEVKTNGKNLFDKDKEKDNFFYNSGGTTTVSQENTFVNQEIPLNNTYTISYSNRVNAASVFAFVRFVEFNASGTFIKRTSLENNKSTIILDSNTRKVIVSVDTGPNAYFEDLQIEKEIVTNPTYEPYKSNTYLYTLDNPLRSIGSIKDLLYIKNGMLYVDRKIGSVVLDGNEDNWNTEADNAYIAITDAKGNNTKSLSNNFIYTKTANNLWGYMKFGNVNNNIIFYKAIVEKSNLASFKSWLSTHNTEVQYLLNEPYTEELGQAQIPNTYEGITYIDILSNINTNSYLQYRQNKTQLEAILQNTNQFSIDSLKTGKILGNPAIDSYDLIQITDGNKIFKTLATNDLVYTGVLINTFDTQIGEEAKEQNVFINGEETFKKWARTTIDNVEGSINLQAGQINEANGRINETNLRIDKDGALLNVIANNSNIDIDYDSAGNPISGEVREVTTTTGFTFNAEGMTIEDTSSNFKAQHRNTGTYYKDGDTIVGQYTKDGSKQKDLDLFGVYTYGKNDINDTPMFIAQLYTDANGEEAFGHFYNRGD